MELNIKIAGIFMILLSLMHIGFPRYFKWEIELKKVSLINKQLMEVHTFFVAFTVFLMGILCMISSNDLINSMLGRRISMGFGIFWGLRLFIQLFGFSSSLWKGKTFETSIHFLFTIIWIYFTISFLILFL
ncbi:MAG: hypothetical protein IPL95_13845 [Saprospiraceae bacterium]|nr:hypothetical protein [Saprospiraceae bacterium]